VENVKRSVESLKPENQKRRLTSSQTAKLQCIVDINIIYHCHEYVTDELKRQLVSNVDKHLLQRKISIDDWLSIFISTIVKKDNMAWKQSEKHFLNLYNS
jgi:hypothetical protein